MPRPEQLELGLFRLEARAVIVPGRDEGTFTVKLAGVQQVPQTFTIRQIRERYPHLSIRQLRTIFAGRNRAKGCKIVVTADDISKLLPRK